MTSLTREIWLRSVDVPFHRSFRLIGRPVLAPFQISFAVTYRCLNLCHTCHSFSKSQAGELSLKEYAAVFDSITFTPFCLTFTGGEPFMRPDFSRIVALACEKLKPPIVIIETCGDHPNRVRRTAQMLAAHYTDTLFLVWLSIDGTYGALDSMRGGVPQSFESLLGSYQSLRQVSASNLLVGFQVLISKHNVRIGTRLIEDVFMLYPDLVGLDVAFGSEALGVVAVDVAPDFDGELESIFDLYDEKMRELRGRSAVRFFKHFLLRRAALARNNLSRVKRSQSCFAGHAYLYIDPAGSVRDCPVAAREMGDLRENQFSLERILKSETARRVRQQVNASDCFCTMSAPALSNIFLSPSEYLRLAGASL
jgi:MoaA/NifB/PqqE/SkfB family radical SAM enzyme